MNMLELCENILRGGEIEFVFKNKKYSITHSVEGIHIMEQYNYSTEYIYKKVEEIGEYPIGNKKLKDVFDKVDITFRCF